MSEKKLNLDVLILAGGQSSRMQSPKALLKINESQNMLEHLIAQVEALTTGRILIAAGNELEKVKASIKSEEMNKKLQWIDDALSENFQGPLSGIASGLENTSTESLIVLSCDIVEFPEMIFHIMHKIMIEQCLDVICAQDSQGRDYPLIAIWNKNNLDSLKQYLAEKKRAVFGFLKTRAFEQYQSSDLNAGLCNINTPQDYQNALTIYHQIHNKNKKDKN